MQTAETLNEGLKRAYTLKITAKEIEARIDGEVAKLAPQMKMPGFRPGKVPANLVRKMHGPQLHQEALNTTIQEGVQKVVAENKLRPAMQPAVELGTGYEPGKDAEITIALEILPDVPTPQIEGIKLERLTAEIDESAVDAQVAQLVGQQKSFDDAPKGHKACPRRPGRHGLSRQGRRRTVRRRQGRGHVGRDRHRTPHPRLRGSADWRSGERRKDDHGDVPRGLQMSPI